jgi:hypothetical protein
MKTKRHLETIVRLAGLLLLTSCSTPSPVAMLPRFSEADRADFVARYYSDQTSYVLKPSMMDGKVVGTRGEVGFFLPCKRDEVLKAAADQRRRELAVVVLIHYPGRAEEEPAKLAWQKDLKALGYQHIVFLRGGKGMEVNGLPILEPPLTLPAIAGK